MDFGGLNHQQYPKTTTTNNNPLLSTYDPNPNPKSHRFKQEQSPSISATYHNQDQQNPLFCYYDRNNTGVRGPFTSSQWMELEHQALIYRYFTVNAPVPSNLLVPVRKSLETATFCSFPAATYGWGGFDLGFSNNSDPEPGRCRRTDGKKWRCSRDAVAEQKYCERHMNRGRHRSRKPVETLCSGAGAGKVSSPETAVTTVSDIVSPFHQQNQKRGNMGFERLQDSTCHSMLSPSRFKIQVNNERSQEEVNWIPVSWEAGGPLGEVLNNGTNNSPPSLNPKTNGRHTTLL